ncbi:uncharacterized protein LOC143039516 [Oratosquilla oratoria]|uniref:uncharacterized protein LOC143039516 n=1 Tax=Oratosquilla oratoria TaxID=337810 RepID=UPI003F765087
MKMRKARQTSNTSVRASPRDMQIEGGRRREGESRGGGGGGGRGRRGFPRRPSGLKKDGRRRIGLETSLVTKRALMVLAYRKTSDCEWLRANGFNDPLPQTLEDMGIDISKVIESFSISETHLTKNIISSEKYGSGHGGENSDDIVRQKAVTSDEIRRLEEQLKLLEPKQLGLKQSTTQCGSYQQPEDSSQKRNTQNESRQRNRRGQGSDQRNNSLSHHPDPPENRKTRSTPQKVNSIVQNDRDLDRKQKSRQQEEDKQRFQEKHQHLKLSTWDVDFGTLSVEDFVARYCPSIVITRVEPKSFPDQNQISSPKSTKVSVQDANQSQDKSKRDMSKETKQICATKIKTKRLTGPSLTRPQSHKIGETVQERADRAQNLESVVPNKDKQTRGGEQMERSSKHNPKKKESSTDKKHKQNQNWEYGSDIVEHVSQKRGGRSHDLNLGHIHNYHPFMKHGITLEHKELKEEPMVYRVRNLTKDNSLESSGNFDKKTIVDQRQNFVKKTVIDQAHPKRTPLSDFKRDFKQEHLSHFNQGLTKGVIMESAKDQSQTLMSDNERDIDQQGRVILKPTVNQDCTMQNKQESVIKLSSGPKVFSQRQLPRQSHMSYQASTSNPNVGLIKDHLPDRKQDLTQIQPLKHEEFCDQEQNQDQKQWFPQKHTLNKKLGIDQKSILISERNVNEEHKADHEQDSKDDTLDHIPQLIPYQGEDDLNQIPQLNPEENSSDRMPHLTPYQEADAPDHIPQFIPDHKLMYNSEVKSDCGENSKAGHTPSGNIIQQKDHVTESSNTDNSNEDLIPPYHYGSGSNHYSRGKNVYRQTKVKELLMPRMPTSTLKFIATAIHQKSFVENKRKRSNDMEEGPRKIKRKTSKAGAVLSKSGVNEITFKSQSKIVNAPIISCQQLKAKDIASADSCFSAQNHKYSANNLTPKSPRCQNRGRVSPVGIHDVMTQQLHLEKNSDQQNATKMNSNAHNTSTSKRLVSQPVNDSRNMNIISNSKTYSQQRKRSDQKKRRRSSTDFVGLPASSEIPSAKRSHRDVEHCPLSSREIKCDDTTNDLTYQCSDPNSHCSLLANPSTRPLSLVPSSNQLNKSSIRSNKFTSEHDFPSSLDSSGVNFKAPKKTPDNQNCVLKDEAIDTANLANRHSHQYTGITHSSNKQIIKVKRHLNNSIPLSHELLNRSTVDGHPGNATRKNVDEKNVDEEIPNGDLRNNCTKLEKYLRKFEHRFKDLKDQHENLQSQLSTDKEKNNGTDESDTDDVHFLGCKKKYSGIEMRKRNPEKFFSDKEWDSNSSSNISQVSFIKINSGCTKNEYIKLKNKSNIIDKEISIPKENIVIQSKHPTVSSYLSHPFTSSIQLTRSSRVQSRNSYGPSTLLKDISSNPEHQIWDVHNSFTYKDELKNSFTQRSIFNNQLSNAGILQNNELILDSQCSNPTSQRGISGGQSHFFDSRLRISNDLFKIRTKIVTPGCQPVSTKSLPIVRKSSPSKSHSISHPNQYSINKILPCDSNKVLTIFTNQYNSPVISLAGQDTPGSHLSTPESQPIITNQFYISSSHFMSHANLFIPISQSSVGDTHHSDTDSQLRVFYGQPNVSAYGSTTNINQLGIRDSILHGQSGIPVYRFVPYINHPTTNIQLFVPGHQPRFLSIQSSTSEGQLRLPNSQYIISSVQPIFTPISHCGILNTQYTIPCSLLKYVGVGFDEVSNQNNQLSFKCNTLGNTLGVQSQLSNTISLPEAMSDNPPDNLSDPSSQTVNVQSMISSNNHYVHTCQCDDLPSCGQSDQSWNCKQNLHHPFGNPSNQLHVLSSQPDETVGKFENLGSQPKEPGSRNLFLYSTDHPENPYDQRCYPWSEFYQPNDQVPHRNNREFDHGNQYYHSLDHPCASLRQSGNDRHQPSASYSECGNINSDAQSQISMVTSKSDILSGPCISRNNQDEVSSTTTSPNTRELARDIDIFLSMSTEFNPLNDTENAMSTTVVKTTSST